MGYGLWGISWPSMLLINNNKRLLSYICLHNIVCTNHRRFSSAIGMATHIIGLLHSIVCANHRRFLLVRYSNLPAMTRYSACSVYCIILSHILPPRDGKCHGRHRHVRVNFFVAGVNFLVEHTHFVLI